MKTYINIERNTKYFKMLIDMCQSCISLYSPLMLKIKFKRLIMYIKLQAKNEIQWI